MFDFAKKWLQSEHCLWDRMCETVPLPDAPWHNYKCSDRVIVEVTLKVFLSLTPLNDTMVLKDIGNTLQTTQFVIAICRLREPSEWSKITFIVEKNDFQCKFAENPRYCRTSLFVILSNVDNGNCAAFQVRLNLRVLMRLQCTILNAKASCFEKSSGRFTPKRDLKSVHFRALVLQSSLFLTSHLGMLVRMQNAKKYRRPPTFGVVDTGELTYWNVSNRFKHLPTEKNLATISFIVYAPIFNLIPDFDTPWEL